jgi:hypothetical protein
MRRMNRHLLLLALCQGLFLTNNVTFIAINGLVGLALAPVGWMATLPVTAYVLGSALAAMPVAWMQARLGTPALVPDRAAAWRWRPVRWAPGRVEPQLLAAAAGHGGGGLLRANAALYRFAGPELVAPSSRSGHLAGAGRRHRRRPSSARTWPVPRATCSCPSPAPIWC